MKHLLILLMSFFIALNVAAQNEEKHDVILKVNGDELSGKVTEIGDSTVKFTYTGEALVYTIKKSDILKITYASGRVEFFNKPALPSETKDAAQKEPNSSKVDRRNKVAILPFTFIADKQSTADEMSYKTQNECYAFLSKHAGELTIVDPRTSNAMLIKAGATPDKIRGFTMGELCSILGVEYIIDGSVSVDKTTQTSSQSGNYKVTDNSNNKSGNSDTKVSGSTSSTTTQNYQTNIMVSVYTDKNTTIFSEERKSFWSGNDAYKNSLQYLLKRTPLYRK